MSTPAAAHCGPDCPSCAPLAARVDELAARLDALALFTSRVGEITAFPAAAGQSPPARRAHLSVVRDGAA